MPRLQAKSFAQPDDVRSMPKVRIETVGLDEATIGHCSFDPGWRWSTDVGPMVGTPSCLIRHLGYTISGSLRVEMDDGESLEVGPNTVFEIPPGHDKWVLGDEPWIVLDWGSSGRAMAAMAPWMWFAGFAGMIALAVIFPNPIILIIVVFAGFETWRRWKQRRAGGAEQEAYYRVSPRNRALVAITYLTLIALLVIGMDATHLARTLV